MLNRIDAASEPHHVPRNVQKSMQVAKDVTGTAANITGFLGNIRNICFISFLTRFFLASKVGTATMALGRFLAPHVQRHGTRLLASNFNMSQDEAAQKVSGALTIAAGAVESFATVYSGLETSAKVLGRNISDNTVKIVQHKYDY